MHPNNIVETERTEEHNFYDAPVVHFPDRSARWLLQDRENVRGLLEILDAELAGQLDFQQLTPINRTFLSEALRQQESDVIYTVPFRESEQPGAILIYLLIEHQSTPDPTMQLRLFIYIAQIWDAHRQRWVSENLPVSQWRLPPIVPILFYTGERQWEAPSLMDLMDMPASLARFVPSFEILFLGVKAADAADLTRTNHPFGWLLTVLQQEFASLSSLTEALVRTLSQLNSMGESEATQYRRAILYLILLVHHRRPSAEHDGLLTLIDNHVPDMEVKTMARSMAEVLIERGVVQGRTEGIVQGRTEEKQADILKLMRFRFQTLPEDIIDQVRAIKDLDRLEALFDKVLTAETFQDIELHPQNGQQPE